MGSKITFLPETSASFALHMDRLPACNESLPQRDWSKMTWTTNGNQNASDIKILSPAYRFCIHTQTSV